MSNKTGIESRWGKLGLIWAVWTLVGLFFASQMYFSLLPTSRSIPFLKALVWQMIAAYMFALATPPVLWLARRFRIELRIWGRRLLLHFLFSVLVSIVLALAHVLNDIWHSETMVFSAINVSRWVLYLLDKEFLVYWTLILMSHAFDYYNRYRNGELRAAQLEAQLSQAQLQSLKMQLHPHFLFNALNAVTELIHDYPQKADRIVTQLSDLLRLALESGKGQEITLKEELDFLSKYVEIQQTLLDDRLSVRMNIDTRTLDACVPNMILQPLVENAIRHGIAPREKGGSVEISAVRRNGTLRLDVHDDGVGLPLDWRGNAGEGIGLSNTRARLNHLYGDAHSFVIEEPSRGGLTISLTLPYRENTGEHTQ